MTTLGTVRFLTADDPYHYTVDNRPLQDLNQNDQVLKTAIDNIASITTISGDWASLVPSLDLSSYWAGSIARPFAYTVKGYFIQNSSLTATQETTITEDLVVGYVNGSGVTIIRTTNIFTQMIGSVVLTRTFSGSGNNLILTTSGYTGTLGTIVMKYEKLGA